MNEPIEVAPGVLVVETSIAAGKAGVIAGDGIALAVDAGIDDAEGATSLAATESMARPAVELVYTHGHVDHALGGCAFRGRPIHAHPDTGSYMASQVKTWAQRTGETPKQLEARLGWPTVPVAHGDSIDLGGRTVRFLVTPGHAPGAICVLDPDAGVLFGGDTIVTAIPPAFSDGDGVVLAETLRGLAGLGAETLVPGHGEVVTGRAAVRAAIAWSADYLMRCHEHVEAHAERDIDAIIAAAPYDRFIGDRLPRDRYRMEWRHEQTLRTLVRQRSDAQ